METFDLLRIARWFSSNLFFFLGLFRLWFDLLKFLEDQVRLEEFLLLAQAENFPVHSCLLEFIELWRDQWDFGDLLHCMFSLGCHVSF